MANTKRRRKKKKKNNKPLALFLFFLVVIVFIVVLVNYNKNKYNAKESTIYVNKNGSVVWTDVHKLDSDKYQVNELEDAVEDAIKDYNDSVGKKKVKKLAVKEKKGTFTTVVKFKSVEDFNQFTGYQLFVGSIDDAIANGYSFEGAFAKLDGKKASLVKENNFVSSKDYTVVALSGVDSDAPYRVRVWGNLTYVSVGNVEVLNKATVNFGLGNKLDGVELADATEPETTTEENTDSASNGSVDEDEMFTGDEDNYPNFVFEDEPTDITKIGTMIVLFK